jgi:hypothetical protein
MLALLKQLDASITDETCTFVMRKDTRFLAGMRTCVIEADVRPSALAAFMPDSLLNDKVGSDFV